MLLNIYFSIVFTCCLITSKIVTSKNDAGAPKAGHSPLIFVLGVQKGGSSSLYEFLIQHPLLCGGSHKEPHFFDHDDLYKQGRRAYTSMYTDVKCADNVKARYVDGTPMMHYMHRVAERIVEFYSQEDREQIKFIVLLREPVSRDYSWYSHVTRAEVALGKDFSDILTFQELDETQAMQDKKVHRYLFTVSPFISIFHLYLFSHFKKVWTLCRATSTFHRLFSSRSNFGVEFCISFPELITCHGNSFQVSGHSKDSGMGRRIST